MAKISKEAGQTILAVGGVGVAAFALYKFLPSLLKPKGVYAASGGGYAPGAGAGNYSPYSAPTANQPKPGPSIGFGNPGSIGGGNSREGAGKPQMPSMPNYKGNGSIFDWFNSIIEGFDASGNGQLVDQLLRIPNLNGDSLLPPIVTTSASCPGLTFSFRSRIKTNSWTCRSSAQVFLTRAARAAVAARSYISASYGGYDSYGYDSYSSYGSDYGSSYGSYDGGYGDYSGYGPGRMRARI